MTQTYLADHVSVAPRYQRSVRIDADFGQADPLSGYVLQGSARDALTTTLRLATNGQGAFTWTGPYGGGKSSLALALASYSLGRGPAFKEAKQLLCDVPEVTAVFGRAPKDWLCVPLSGRRGDPVADLREALASAIAGEPGHARTKRSKMEAADGRDIVERLQREVEARPKGGVLVIVDELGKYLEGAADHAIDIHFFQDLAEAANRSEGRLIVVGVLHQAFERYADRLGQSVQDEWRKIQGRFADVPIITAVDEVIELVGRAVTTERSHPQSHAIAAVVASEIAERRPGVPKDLAERLGDCWPLNPAAAALLGPITRRRFSQNERSLFGFLASAEPNGFTEFLQRTTLASGRTFGPAELWDYLQVNLEPAIMASPDGHRWAQAAEAIARAARDGNYLRLQIAKTVAVIDLFSNGSGLAASSRTIAASLEQSDTEVEEQLANLVKISALVYRRHLGAYAIYAGSDFDIEGEIEARIAERGRLEIAALNDLASLQPILAKRHYAEYGTPRWFDAQIGELAPQGLGPKDGRVSAGAAGKFLLLLPGIDVDPDEAEASVIEASRTNHRHGLPVIVGLASNSADIRKTAIELEAARDVRNESPELAGDAAARREIDARIAHLSAQLEGLLREGFERAHWFDTGKPLDLDSLSYGLSQAASDIARRTFRQAPIVHSELINRRRPSSNSNAALRALLHAIVVGRGEQHFGITGYPAEKGLAVTVLERAGLYVRQGERWAFLQSWDAGISNALKRAKKEVRKLDLEDLSHVKRMLSTEGVPLGGYMVDIMDAVLAHELEADQGVIDAAANLNSLQATSYPPNSITGNKNTLEVVRKTLFVHNNRQQLDPSEGFPVSLGDIIAIPAEADRDEVRKNTIFESEERRVFLVLTPACDLIRENPKAKRVLLLAGAYHDQGALNLRAAMRGEYTPALDLGAGQRGVVTWDLKHIETVSMETITNLLSDEGPCVVAARLREHPAIALQQKLLSGLGRVGELKAMPSMFPVHCVVSYTNQEKELTALPTKLDGILVDDKPGRLAFDAALRFDFMREVRSACAAA